MTILVNQKERALIDSETGIIVRPACFDTLVPYHSYLVGRGHSTMANEVLKRVFDGEKFISKLIDNYQKREQ